MSSFSRISISNCQESSFTKTFCLEKILMASSILASLFSRSSRFLRTRTVSLQIGIEDSSDINSCCSVTMATRRKYLLAGMLKTAPHPPYWIHFQRYAARSHSQQADSICANNCNKKAHQLVGPCKTQHCPTWKSLQTLCVSLVVMLHQTLAKLAGCLPAGPVLRNFMQHSSTLYTRLEVNVDVISGVTVE